MAQLLWDGGSSKLFVGQWWRGGRWKEQTERGMPYLLFIYLFILTN